MTVRELIDLLEKFPDDALVLRQYEDGSYGARKLEPCSVWFDEVANEALV